MLHSKEIQKLKIFFGDIKLILAFQFKIIHPQSFLDRYSLIIKKKKSRDILRTSIQIVLIRRKIFIFICRNSSKKKK